jgi:ABC-2 type transport system ATP-binding protein
VGPNGCGKTTTIRIMGTLLPPDSGVVEIGGHDVIAKAREARRLVGYMPDTFGMYDGMTVGEYLDFFAGVHGFAVRERRQLRDELLELLDLTDVDRCQASALSRGLRQRLGLARCLISDPEVLLLDEPASGLDPDSRVELRDILTELGSLGKTIIMTSNVLAELAETCTRIAIVKAGKILVEGPTAEFPCLEEGTLEDVFLAVANGSGGQPSAQPAHSVMADELVSSGGADA